MIEIKDLYLEIDGKTILKNINFDMKNEIITLIGPSGCGKTSLLKSILGINKSKGEIIINGKDLSRTPIEDRNISIVFQDYVLFPHLTVFDNINIIADDIVKSKQILNRFNIGHLSDKLPSMLSGGETQRVSIARALLTKPDLLLLDEPFSNVDAITKQDLERDIKKILKDLKVPTIIVTHNKNDAFFMSDRAIVMKDGKIEQINNLNSLYEYPESRFVAGLLGEYNMIKQGNDDILLRPEWITVESAEVGFNVVSCVYYGMYNRLLISDGNIFNTLIVYDFNKKVKIGDKVSIKIRKTHILRNN